MPMRTKTSLPWTTDASSRSTRATVASASRRAEGIVLADLEDVVERRGLDCAERRGGLRCRGLGDHRRVTGAVLVVGVRYGGEGNGERHRQSGDPRQHREARGGEHDVNSFLGFGCGVAHRIVRAGKMSLLR